MKREHAAKCAAAAFLLACLLPSLGMLFAPTVRTAANQRLHGVPRLRERNGDWNLHVLTDTADYLADHLAFRQELITLNAALNAALFHVSTEEQVALGKQDWLFYRHTLADYLRTEPLSERELWSAVHTLSLLREYAAERGAAFYVAVAPNKAGLYPEYLPRVGEPLEGRDDRDRFSAALEQAGVAYLDLYGPFRERGETLYFHTDSHWTTRGAALAHDVLCEALKGGEAEGNWAAFFPGSTHDGAPHRGDLYEMLYPAGTYQEPDAAFDRSFAFSYVSAYRGPEDHIIDTACPGRDGSLLCFRDSFGNSLHPFLADSFGTARFSRAMPVDMSQMEGQDTVLLEIVERNLDYLASKAPIFPAPERETEDLPPCFAEAAKPCPAEGTAPVELRVQGGGTLEGYVRVEGWLDRETDTDSPVCIRLGAALYEASPVGERQGNRVPFTLYVEAERYRQASGMEVLYCAGNTLYTASLDELPMV